MFLPWGMQGDALDLSNLKLRLSICIDTTSSRKSRVLATFLVRTILIWVGIVAATIEAFSWLKWHDSVLIHLKSQLMIQESNIKKNT